MAIRNQKIVLVFGSFHPYAAIHPMFEKVVNGVISDAPDLQKKNV